MTIRGYIGNDPSLKIAFDAAHVQAGVDILMELTSGAQEVAGPWPGWSMSIGSR